MAMCSASSPAVCDFSCGFQPSLSCGMRSRNLRVILDSCSNSPSMACAMDICAPLKKWIESNRVTLREPLLTALFLRGRADMAQHFSPAFAHILLEFRFDQTKGLMGEFQQRAA